MLKTELEIVTVGTPDIAALSENEQNSFALIFYGICGIPDPQPDR